jgi:hypothetical protein
MGRKPTSKEHKKAKQREWNRKYLFNPNALARAREGNRLRMQERRRRERQTSVGRQASLADTVSQAESMPCVGEEKEEDAEDEEDNTYSDFDNNGNDWGSGGFGDNGFNDIESMTIMTIITDVCRLFKCQTRGTSQSTDSMWAGSTNHNQLNVWSEDRLIKLTVRRR